MMRWLTANWPLKLLSLAIAIVLWVFVRVEARNELALRVPLQYANIPEQLVMISDPEPELQVVVEGPGTLLASLERESQTYKIDFEDARPGRQEVRISTDRIRLPRGVHVLRVVPSVIEVEFAQTERKMLPVRAILAEDSIAPGYEIGNVEIEPERIEIVAAKTELAGLEALETETLPLHGAKTDWSGVVQLKTDALHIKSITTREVDVYVKVVPVMVERLIADVPVQVRGPREQYRLSPDRATVRVFGPENLVKKLTPEAVEVYVNVRRPISGRARLPVMVDLPEQVALMDIQPSEVIVERTN
ncbi:MAG: hypothetical protein D6761_06005 [Candidatus Dadabacteria bacterium]|nr:MAG: hypothetical protein D6761_06005 [Candidatus Dadabacteria bacterium]